MPAKSDAQALGAPGDGERPNEVVALRPALPDDLTAAHAILQAAFARYVGAIGRRPQPMDRDLTPAAAEGRLIVADRGGAIVGCAEISAVKDGAAELTVVAVHPALQGLGEGRALIAAAENAAREAGAQRITLYTNAAMTQNLALYPRLGYCRTGTVRQDGFDRVTFEKPLPPRLARRKSVEGLYGRRRIHRHRDSPDLSRYALDLAAPPDLPGPLRLEVGFGAGEHLLAHALACPAVTLIGAEAFESGMTKLLRALAAQGLTNVRVHMGDAREVLDWLPPGSLERVDILYPDPWPKRKHWKRRFVSMATLDRLERVLTADGEVRFASDIPSYVEWTRAHVAAHRGLALQEDSAEPWQGWGGTRYEAKALRAGRRPRYLTVRPHASAPTDGARVPK